MWKVMKPSFDRQVTEHYEKHFAAGGWTINFIKAFRPQLLLFMEEPDLSHMEKAVLQDGADPDATICRRLLSSSRIGAALFYECGKRLDYLVFQSTLKRRPEELDFHDFDPTEVATFKKLISSDIKALHDGGHKSWDRKTSPVDLGSQLRMSTSSLHDEVDFRYMAKLKAIGMNTGKVNMLPWEAALWNEGEIPNARTACPVPDELLGDITNVRDACRRLLNADDVTFGDMKRTVAPYVKTLMALDRTFIVEYTFLCDHASSLAEEQVQTATLELLPSQSKQRPFNEALRREQEVYRLPWLVCRGSDSAVTNTRY